MAGPRSADLDEMSDRDSNAPVALRVLSYNVRHGQGVASFLSNARLARVISAISPAVAGLNEVWCVEGLYDQPQRLGSLTHMAPFYHAAHDSWLGQTGNLMLAAGTVHGVEMIDLGGRRERRGCLVADVDTGGVRYSFAVTHLSLHRSTRQTQLELLAVTLPVHQPLILVGDFNCACADLGVLGEVLTFTPDSPPTFPSLHPIRALDHIGYSSHWVLDKLVAVPSLASDHRPLVGELRLVG